MRKLSGLERRMGRNLAWTVVSMAGDKLILFVTVIYLARVLGAEGFGVLAAAQAFTISFWLAADMGISKYGTREIARSPHDAVDIVNKLMGLRIAAGALVFVSFVLYVALFDQRNEIRAILLICSLSFLTNALLSDWVFRGLEDFRSVTLATLASSGFYLVMAVVFVRSKAQLPIVAAVWALSFAISSSLLLRMLWKRGLRVMPQVDLRSWWMHGKESVHFVLSGTIMVLIIYLPTMILSGVTTPLEVGIFSAPYQLVVSTFKVGFIVQTAFFPVLAETYVGDKAAFRAVFGKFRLLMLGLGVLVALSGFLLGEWLILLLLGKGYVGSVPVFMVLAGAIVFRFLRFPYESALTAVGYQRWQVVVAALGLVTLTGAFALQSHAQMALAMAKSTLLAEVVLLAASLLAARFTYQRTLAT